MATTEAAVVVVVKKSNRVPDPVARMVDARDRLAWLATAEAEALLTHKRRRELKRRWGEEAAGGTYRGPSHELVTDPQAAARASAEAKIVEGLTIEQRRRQAVRGTVDGDAPCWCRYCREQAAHWPGPYVDARPRSYECHLEHNPPPEEEGPNRSHGERVSKGDALRGGLRERDPDRRSIWAPTVEPACEGGCGKIRMKGCRYCRGCRNETIRVLTLAGWEADRIAAFLDPKDKI